MKVYKVVLFDGADSYIDESADSVAQFLQCELNELEQGQTATINVFEMSEAVYKNLPEWCGP
jgi:hypothetical protein